MNSTRRPWYRALAVVAAGAALALTAACSTSSGGTAASNSKPEADRAGPAAAKGGGQAPNLDAQNGAAPQQPQPAGQQPQQVPAGDAADQRAIIYTGTMTVRVSNVDEAALKATATAEGAGGFVGGDQRTNDDGKSQAHIVLRVPSAKFTSVIGSLAKLGKEESRELSTEDVTSKAVDLDARIATAQASVDRVRALLAKAQSMGDIVSIESELSRREADLESLQAQKRKLTDLTTLSTITVVLLGPQAAAAKPAKPESGFLAGIKGGWRAFAASMEVLLTILGALLPWFLTIGVPVFAALWFIRRARRRPERAPLPPEPAAEAPQATG
jgi:hypothetical protein